MYNNFVHLNLHTEYSLIDGVGKIDEYLKKAKELNMTSMAITDTGNMFGAVEFYKKAKDYGIKPIIGMEILISEFEMTKKEGKNFSLILLAKNLEGYKNLIKITTLSYKYGFYKKPRIDKKHLIEYSDGLIALTSSLDGEIPQAIINYYDKEINFCEITNKIDEYVDIFGEDNFYLEVQPGKGVEQNFINKVLLEISKKNNYKIVATNNTHYVNDGDEEVQDIIICIQTGKKQSDYNRQKASKYLYLKSYDEMLNSLGPDYNEAILNSLKIAEKCNLEIEFGNLQFPYYEVPEPFLDADEYLKFLCIESLKKKYNGKVNENIMNRLKYELDMIKKMGYSTYFIVVWDFIYYAEKNEIPIGPGRGSAAGSLVSYLLNITKIDPIKYNLIFERFLNPERISMPDIDIDICQERRQEVIDYVRDKYGADRVAHIITFGTLKARAAVRDVSRVLDINLNKVDRVAKLIDRNMNIYDTLQYNQEFKKIYSTDLEIRKVIDYSLKLEGRIRNISTHAAGIVITKDNLDEVIPTYLDSTENISVTQYQMKELEELGILKMDFLGLRNLTIIKRCLDYIKESEKIELNIYEIDLEDKEVYKMLSSGDTLGVFQMEAYGFRNVLKKLRPNKFEDIIAMLSLYRPGPLNSGMVDQFINCKHGLEEIKYPHPNLKEILKETYGVILYQEQVMRIANVMANYSLGEADLLRRAMGKKNFEIMNENREKFVNRSVDNGYTIEKANEIFDLIYKFAGYGFNKSHSAAYAMLSYFTAYLKTHYSKYYYASLMTSDISNIENIAIYFNDAKQKGVKISLPDVNKPSTLFTVAGDEIIFSLSAIKNIGYSVADSIVKEFNLNGPYKDIYDVYIRNKKKGINKKTMEALVYSGALDNLPGNRREKIDSIDSMILLANKKSQKDDIQQMNLFLDQNEKIIETFKLPNKEEFSDQEKINREIEFLGFYISLHPLEKYNLHSKLFSLKKIKDINIKENSKIETYGIIKNLKIIKTKKDDFMCIFNLECFNKILNVVVYPRYYNLFIDTLKENNTIFIKGNVVVDEFKGEKNLKLNANFLMSLDDFIPNKKTSVYILIENEDRSKFYKMKELFMSNKGQNNIIFAFNRNGQKFTRKSDMYVDFNYQLIDSLIDLIGIDKIRAKLPFYY